MAIALNAVLSLYARSLFICKRNIELTDLRVPIHCHMLAAFEAGALGAAEYRVTVASCSVITISLVEPLTAHAVHANIDCNCATVNVRKGKGSRVSEGRERQNGN